MHDWLLQTWYGPTRRGRWLMPLAWLFSAAASLRHWAYRCGLRRCYRSSRVIVVVGNLSVGGTGKTPLVAWLIETLKQRGLRVGAVSRGYGGAHAGPIRLRDDSRSSEVGDEALWLARHCQVPVAVGVDRPAAVRLLEDDCELIICDDGLQHYALERDVEIMVVDGERGLGNGLRLPAGPLREAASRLDDAAAVVVNGPGFFRTGALHMDMAATGVRPTSSGELRSLEQFRGTDVHAVAAIGHPERFFSLLRGAGLRVEAHAFRDHLRLPASAFTFADGKPVLTTAKDAVRFEGAWPENVWVLEAEAIVSRSAADQLLAPILRALASHQEGDHG